MEAYTGFAGVYDSFMDDTPYAQWRDNIVRELKNYGIEDGLVLELGCGTGEMTGLLSEAGYDMIGVDASEEMLSIAMDKRADLGLDILYLRQDMREFELYGTVRAVVSVCDSINYLLSDDDILKCFRLVDNYLDPGGIFMFDFNTKYKYQMIGEATIAENREDCSFIWENYYDDESCINEYGLTIFEKSGEKSADGQDIFFRFYEEHMQRGYSLDEMEKLIEEAGLLFVRAYDADTLGDVTDESERVYCVAQENKKKR